MLKILLPLTIISLAFSAKLIKKPHSKQITEWDPNLFSNSKNWIITEIGKATNVADCKPTLTVTTIGPQTVFQFSDFKGKDCKALNINHKTSLQLHVLKTSSWTDIKDEKHILRYGEAANEYYEAQFVDFQRNLQISTDTTQQVIIFLDLKGPENEQWLPIMGGIKRGVLEFQIEDKQYPVNIKKAVIKNVLAPLWKKWNNWNPLNIDYLKQI